MQNMKYLFVATAITLFAGLVPLVLVASAVGIFIAKVAIAIAVIGLAVTLTLYFMQETRAVLSLRDEDFDWH